MAATSGKGQPTARRPVSSVTSSRAAAIQVWKPSCRNPYWSDSASALAAIQAQQPTPTAAMTAPEIRPPFVRAAKISTQGRASAMCSGRLTRLGIRPEKISHR